MCHGVQKSWPVTRGICPADRTRLLRAGFGPSSLNTETETGSKAWQYLSPILNGVAVSSSSMLSLLTPLVDVFIDPIIESAYIPINMVS